MKTHVASPSESTRRIATASVRHPADTALSKAIYHSPRQAAQRRAMDAAFGSAVQRQDASEEELQLKADPALVQCQEDDELQLQAMPEEEPLQAKLGAVQLQAEDDEIVQGKLAPSVPVQREAESQPNNTGMPDTLKSGLEALSGMDMSDVRVHRNSAKPAQLSALAYAQGNDIHLGAGQEQHLAHEAWHVVQQRQGRVQATTQMAGVGVNDDAGLEREADVMGAKALNGAAQLVAVEARQVAPAQLATETVQRMTILRDGDAVEVDDDHVLQSNERLPFDAGKREQIDQTLREAREAVGKPSLGISNRPGLGFDVSVFTLEDDRQKHDRVTPISMPPGFLPLPRETEPKRAEQEKLNVQKGRNPHAVASHLNAASGLFIPGGQDRDAEGSREKLTRSNYERALVREARTRGMPTLAVCGGSRAFASAFGGSEKELVKGQVKTHSQKTDSQAHGLTFPDPHTLLGSATPTPGTLDKINSTHKKVVATDPDGRLSGVPDLPGTGRTIKRPKGEGGDIHIPKESELVVSALDSVHGTPEGFETRYGAPLMGITSHPEAIYRGSTDRSSATVHAREWSDNLFTGFDQAMRAYSGRLAVNEQIDPGEAARLRARRANPGAYEKWLGKRNWQKLLHLGMISDEEADAIKQEVAQHRQAKSDYFRAGRPGRERPDYAG